VEEMAVRDTGNNPRRMGFNDSSRGGKAYFFSVGLLAERRLRRGGS